MGAPNRGPARKTAFYKKLACHSKVSIRAVAPPYTILNYTKHRNTTTCWLGALLFSLSTRLQNSTQYDTMKTQQPQNKRLEQKLAKKLLAETRDTLIAITKNEGKAKKVKDTSLPFPIQEIQVHLLDEDGEGMVLWLQGSIEKGKVHIEKGVEEITDLESIQVELEEHDPYEEEEDAIIEEMFTTVGKKPVFLN